MSTILQFYSPNHSTVCINVFTPMCFLLVFFTFVIHSRVNWEKEKHQINVINILFFKLKQSLSCTISVIVMHFIIKVFTINCCNCKIAQIVFDIRQKLVFSLSINYNYNRLLCVFINFYFMRSIDYQLTLSIFSASFLREKMNHFP